MEDLGENKCSRKIRKNVTLEAISKVSHDQFEPSEEEVAEKSYQIGTKYFKAGKLYEKSFEHFEVAASKNHAKAQYSLGVIYEFGLGKDKSYLEGLMWYKRASENGYKKATNAQRRIESFFENKNTKSSSETFEEHTEEQNEISNIISRIFRIMILPYF